MKTLKLVLAAAVAVPLAAGCGRQQADTGRYAETGTPAQTGTLSMDDVELGKALSPDGDVKETTDSFLAGEPVFAEVEASTLAPGTNLKLEWIGPQGTKVSTDELVVPEEARVITLTAKDTARWQPGTYHLDVVVGGNKIGSKTFTIGDRAAAD